MYRNINRFNFRSVTTIFHELRNVPKYYVLSSCNLHNESMLGLDAYKFERRNSLQRQELTVERFKDKIKTSVAEDENYVVYHDDLKLYIHICENNEEDLSTVLNLATKYHAEGQKTVFGDYRFGPVIMRMYHFLQRPNEALAAFNSIENCFNQVSSFIVLMDLLYEQKQYEDVLKVYHRQKDILTFQINVTCVYIALAALYKMNTPESLVQCEKIFEDMQIANVYVSMNQAMLAGALAVNQRQPHKAQDIMDLCNRKYFEIKNVKLLTLAQMNNFNACIAILRAFCHFNSKEQLQNNQRYDNQRREQLCRDVVQTVGETIRERADEGIVRDFERQLKVLEENDLLSNETLDELVTRTPPPKPKRDMRSGDGGDGGDFGRSPVSREGRRSMLESAFNKNAPIRKPRRDWD